MGSPVAQGPWSLPPSLVYGVPAFHSILCTILSSEHIESEPYAILSSFYDGFTSTSIDYK